MRSVSNTNAAVITEFRANGGVVQAPYDDPPPMVLLHTIGARSGREHIVPMRGMPDTGLSTSSPRHMAMIATPTGTTT